MAATAGINGQRIVSLRLIELLMVQKRIGGRTVDKVYKLVVERLFTETAVHSYIFLLRFRD